MTPPTPVHGRRDGPTTLSTTPGQTSVASTSPGTPTSTATPSTTTIGNGGGGSGGFYNNLFYILIAVLGAFALVSIFNIFRTRRRRRIIINEAERLGLMVPGMSGYVPMRERPAFIKADGWRTPDWWEVTEKNHEDGDDGGGGAADTDAATTATDTRTEKRGVEGAVTVVEPTRTLPAAADEVEVNGATADTISRPQEAGPSAPSSSRGDKELEQQQNEYGARGVLEVTSLDDLHPLAIVPTPIVEDNPPKPWSNLPFFPNYVSYPKSAHIPRPPRFAPDDPDAFDSIVGEPLEVIVALRMPTPAAAHSGEVDGQPAGEPRVVSPDDDDAVMHEWGGLELGVLTMTVAKGEQDVWSSHD